MTSRDYPYPNALPGHTHTYLWPTVTALIEDALERSSSRRVFELGCGNGAYAAALDRRGIEMTGVDPSATGIAQARQAYPHLRLYEGSSEEALAECYGRHPVVVSLEVVEHVYAPRSFARCVYDLVADNGVAILSTPYHGYLKNLALAVSGRMDDHFTALWDNGHIKFWSERTLGTLLREAGFASVAFHRTGRIPPLAKSMVVVAMRNDVPRGALEQRHDAGAE